MGNMFCGCVRNDSNNTTHSPYYSQKFHSQNLPHTTLLSKKITSSSTNNKDTLPLTNITSSFSYRTHHSMTINEELLFTLDKAVFIGKGHGTPSDIYQFGQKLGEGSFGSVYIIKHKQTGDLRAVKVIRKCLQHPTQNKTSHLTKDILREIELLKSLDHQNIIKLFEFYEGEKMFYIITEYCKGGELFTKLKQEGGQDEITSALIMFQLFSAINYCHSRKVMHRDLKPENIMLEDQTKNGMINIRIIDFGTAKLYENEYEDKIIGTPYYIAPEVIDRKYNEKCDLWSLGVIMYVLLKGKFPFGGSEKQQIFKNIKKGVYDITSPPFDKVSNEAKELIKKLLVLDPNQRITAEHALNEPWFTKLKIKEKLSEISPTAMRNMLNNIKHYRPDKVLQQAALAYLVHNNPQMEEVHNACSLYIKIDKNNDGLIVKSEFVEGMKYLFKEHGEDINNDILDELFMIIDADGSGDIEYEEFVRAALDKRKFIDETILKFAFDYFDADKSGKITLDEVKGIFQQNKEFPEQDFQLIIDQVDKNFDGMIDFNEFTEMMTNILKS